MKADRFVLELPLRDPAQPDERLMLARLNVARLAWNAFVAEIDRRAGLMRESVEYRRLSAEFRAFKGKVKPINPRIVTFKTDQERTAAWRAMRQRFCLYGKYPLSDFVKAIAVELKPRTGSSGLQCTLLHELAARAWIAYKPHLYGKSSGRKRRGAPRRRSRYEPLMTISTRATEKNQGPIRFTSDGTVTWRDAYNGGVIKLRALVDSTDVVACHALSRNSHGQLAHPICQLRIGHRLIRGRRRWFVQLVLEGKAFRKERVPIADGPVGVDVGSKHIAIVAPEANYAEIALLNGNVARSLQEGRRIERRRARAQDRSRRATNPDAFDAKGCCVRGKRLSVRSKRFHTLGSERQENHRVLNETKRQQTAALANRIIALGTSIHIEDLAYRSWLAGRMGRSMLASTPGALATSIKRAASKYDRVFVAINAHAAKLSQRCHACTALHKDSLYGPIMSRLSTCGCGRRPMQRDQYAAFLASFCDADGTLDTSRATDAWARMSRSSGAVVSGETQPVSSATSPIRSICNVASEPVAAQNWRMFDAGACEVRAGTRILVSEATRDRMITQLDEQSVKPVLRDHEADFGAALIEEVK